MDIIINRKPVSVPVLPLLALIALLILALSSARIASVQGDQIGVFVNNLTKSVSIKLQSGSSIYNGLLTDFYTLQKAERTIKMNKAHNDEVRIKTGDGSDIELDVDINYRLIPGEKEVKLIVHECGLAKVVPYGARFGKDMGTVDAYHERWIREYSRSVVRHVFGELDPKAFYDAAKRDEKAAQALRELNDALNQHGIEVTQVVPGEYSYYEEYKELIDQKKAADQEVENQREEKKTAERDQERQIKEAEAVVKAKVAEMDGILKKEFLTAEADAARERLGVEAQAYSLKTAADANLTKAKNEALAKFALASAEAEGLRKLA
ncbi:MAG: hypothetical protein KDC87_14305, partial [Planctomycetes bacterium]|nr:hypothetical protein [Planctomycetota bacterium]